MKIALVKYEKIDGEDEMVSAFRFNLRKFGTNTTVNQIGEKNNYFEGKAGLSGLMVCPT